MKCLPEIYQIEVTNACNLGCEFCQRSEAHSARNTTRLDIGLARTIAERDLGGSHFVEFQQAGEPLLHTQLKEIISFFKGSVQVGLSTNGQLIDKQIEACLLLDTMTVSIDSLDPDKYAKLRVGGTLDKLLENLDLLFSKVTYQKIDLQVIEFPGYEVELENLHTLVEKKGWDTYADVSVRSVPDNFLLSTSRNNVLLPSKKKQSLCVNPWSSVSVHADGKVVPCCFAFGEEVVYGQLTNEVSLQHIWETSEELLSVREALIKSAAGVSGATIPSLCTRCYNPSPVFFHWDMYVASNKPKR